MSSFSVYIIIEGNCELTIRHAKLLRQLMDNNVHVMINGYLGRPSSCLMEYFDRNGYADVELCFCDDCGLWERYDDTHWGAAEFPSDSSHTDVIEGAIQKSDLCIVITNCLDITIFGITHRSVVANKTPINVVYYDVNNPSQDIDAMLLPDNMGIRIGVNMSTKGLAVSSYLKMRSNDRKYPTILHYDDIRDFDGDVVNEIPVSHVSAYPTVFIGGSCSIDSLPMYFRVFLDLVMTAGSRIVVGDAPGVDTNVQNYLDDCHYKNVTVYYTATCRSNVSNWESCQIPPDRYPEEDGYWTEHMPKDIAMCNACTYGLFLWDRTSRATAKNFERLSAMGKKTIVLHDSIMDKYARSDIPSMYIVGHTAQRGKYFNVISYDQFLTREEIKKLGLLHVDGFKKLDTASYKYGSR